MTPKLGLLCVLALMILGLGCFQPADDRPLTPAPTPVSGVSPEGGTVELAGLRLDFPPGAVREVTPVTIEPTDVPAPAGHRRIGGKYLLGPEGASFGQPVKMTFSLDQPVAEGAAVKVATAPQGSTQFELLEAVVADGRLVATTVHFSTFQPVIVLAGDAGEQPLPDAGAPEDAGTPEDAGLDGGAAVDAGTPADAGLDGGAAVDAGTLCDPGIDAGACGYISHTTAPTSCRFQAYCQGGRQTLTCTGTGCTCEFGSTRWTFSAPYDCAERTMMERWTCECGFAPRPTGPIACVAPGTNVSDGGTQLYSLPIGAICPGGTGGGGQSCAYGLCFNGTFGWTCTRACDHGFYCPCGWRCVQWYPSPEAMACVPQ